MALLSCPTCMSTTKYNSSSYANCPVCGTALEGNGVAKNVTEEKDVRKPAEAVDMTPTPPKIAHDSYLLSELVKAADRTTHAVRALVFFTVIQFVALIVAYAALAIEEYVLGGVVALLGSIFSVKVAISELRLSEAPARK